MSRFLIASWWHQKELFECVYDATVRSFLPYRNPQQCDVYVKIRFLRIWLCCCKYFQRLFRCRCFSFECKNTSNLIRQTKPFKRDYKLHYIMHGKHRRSYVSKASHGGMLDKTVKLQIKKHKLLLRLSWKCNIFCYPEGFRKSITWTGSEECQAEERRGNETTVLCVWYHDVSLLRFSRHY